MTAIETTKRSLIVEETYGEVKELMFDASNNFLEVTEVVLNMQDLSIIERRPASVAKKRVVEFWQLKLPLGT